VNDECRPFLVAGAFGVVAGLAVWLVGLFWIGVVAAGAVLGVLAAVLAA